MRPLGEIKYCVYSKHEIAYTRVGIYSILLIECVFHNTVFEKKN